LLFDLRPKERLAELFDRRSEYEELSRLVRSGEWVAVLGRRMTGKTSLVKTFVKETGGLYVNLMGIRGLAGLAQALRQSLGAELRDLELDLVALRVRWAKTVENIFSRIGGQVVVFDEAQEMASPNFLRLLKSLRDTYSGLRLVFTGSYVGVLRRMLEPDEGSPLYGRQPARIELKPFSRDLSREFLLRGFAEHRMVPREGELDEALESLDGYPGWLTYYGNFRCVRRMSHEEALEATLREAVKILLEELDHFLLRRRRELYARTLRMLRHGARWSELRDELGVNEKVLRDILSSLEGAGLIAREGGLYVVADPIVRKAAARLRPRGGKSAP